MLGCKTFGSRGYNDDRSTENSIDGTQKKNYFRTASPPRTNASNSHPTTTPPKKSMTVMWYRMKKKTPSQIHPRPRPRAPFPPFHFHFHFPRPIRRRMP
jgi:hypothetical protein